MKKHLFTLLAILFVPLFLYAQADKILGTWYNDDKTSAIQIAKESDGKFDGKIVWLDEPNENGKPKIDDDNPDPKLATRPIMGLKIVNDFRYSTKKKIWENATIYDPKNGKTYDCFAWFENGDFNTTVSKGICCRYKSPGSQNRVDKKELVHSPQCSVHSAQESVHNACTCTEHYALCSLSTKIVRIRTPGFQLRSLLQSFFSLKSVSSLLS